MVTRKKTKVATVPAKPRGREAVSAAVLDAARVLFASRPYKDVTMREIAEAARVNLGLLHRHFGSKEMILQAVIQAYATHFHDMVLESPSTPQAMLTMFSDVTQAPFLRTLAHLILADLPVHDFIAHDGALAVMLGGEVLSRKGAKGLKAVVKSKDTSANVLVAFALFMGWSLFENFLIEASGQRVSHKGFRDEVFKLGNALLVPATESPTGIKKRAVKAT